MPGIPSQPLSTRISWDPRVVLPEEIREFPALIPNPAISLVGSETPPWIHPSFPQFIPIFMVGRDGKTPFSIPEFPQLISEGWERPEEIFLEFRGLSCQFLAVHCLGVVVKTQKKPQRIHEIKTTKTPKKSQRSQNNPKKNPKIPNSISPTQLVFLG